MLDGDPLFFVSFELKIIVCLLSSNEIPTISKVQHLLFPGKAVWGGGLRVAISLS